MFDPATEGGLYGILEGVGDWTLLPSRATRFRIVAILRSECIEANHGGAVRVPRGWVLQTLSLGQMLNVMVPRAALEIQSQPIAEIEHRLNERKCIRDQHYQSR